MVAIDKLHYKRDKSPSDTDYYMTGNLSRDYMQRSHAGALLFMVHTSLSSSLSFIPLSVCMSVVAASYSK